jgi:hypothetical protein
VKLYEKQRKNLPPSAMTFLSNHLAPHQVRTHAAMSSLKAGI